MMPIVYRYCLFYFLALVSLGGWCHRWYAGCITCNTS
jgi:hypothetical protein